MRNTIRACAVLLALWHGTAVAQQSAADEQAIRNALIGWMQDFNAGRAERVCGLFDQELRYDYRGFPERGYQQICDLLHRSLADPARQFHYELDIKEVLVSGDLAAVRLVWLLTVTPRGSSMSTSSQEPGMDLLRRQPDGSWRIIRYIAYEAPG